MSVTCYNCGVSLHWNYALEAKAKEHGHPVFCKKCAKKHRKNQEKKHESQRTLFI